MLLFKTWLKIIFKIIYLIITRVCIVHKILMYRCVKMYIKKPNGFFKRTKFIVLEYNWFIITVITTIFFFFYLNSIRNQELNIILVNF